MVLGECSLEPVMSYIGWPTTNRYEDSEEDEDVEEDDDDEEELEEEGEPKVGNGVHGESVILIKKPRPSYQSATFNVSCSSFSSPFRTNASFPAEPAPAPAAPAPPKKKQKTAPVNDDPIPVVDNGEVEGEEEELDEVGEDEDVTEDEIEGELEGELEGDLEGEEEEENGVVDLKGKIGVDAPAKVENGVAKAVTAGGDGEDWTILDTSRSAQLP